MKAAIGIIAAYERISHERSARLGGQAVAAALALSWAAAGASSRADAATAARGAGAGDDTVAAK